LSSAQELSRLASSSGRIHAVLGEEIRRAIEGFEKALLDPESKKLRSASMLLDRDIKTRRHGYIEEFRYVLRVGDQRGRSIARVEIIVRLDGRAS